MRTSKRTRILMVLVTLAISLGWIQLRVSAFGSPSALLAVGRENVGYDLIRGEIPAVYTFDGSGFDGMPFYVIARNPFNLKKASRHLEPPTYRLRRILFPLAAKALAPHGGMGLVMAFALLSLIGIAIGSWWLGAFPNAPPWLPLMMTINPGVICALFTSISDALAAGLVIASFGAMFNKRVRLAIVFLALAALTRETSLAAGLAFFFWPGLTKTKRIAVAIIPAIPVTAWSIYVSMTLRLSFFAQPPGGTFTIPFLGWARAETPGGELLLAAFLLVTLAAGTFAAWSRSRPVAIFLAITVAMYVCGTPVIVYQWIGFARLTTPALPLAIWALTYHASSSPRTSKASTKHNSALRAS